MTARGITLPKITFQSFDPTADLAAGLTAAVARSVFDYDDEAGIILWKQRTGRRVRVGQRAGTKHRSGYWRVALFGKSYNVSHIVWLIVTGAAPHDELDHRDGDKDNNRFGNLREATRGQNEANKPSRNKHGPKGVTFERRTGRWRAKIESSGRTVSLGTYATIDEAASAFRRAALARYGDFART